MNRQRVARLARLEQSGKLAKERHGLNTLNIVDNK